VAYIAAVIAMSTAVAGRQGRSADLPFGEPTVIIRCGAVN